MQNRGLGDDNARQQQYRPQVWLQRSKPPWIHLLPKKAVMLLVLVCGTNILMDVIIDTKTGV